MQTEQQFKDTAARLQTPEGQVMVNKVKALTAFAEGGMVYVTPGIRTCAHSAPILCSSFPPELGCSVSQLALAWVAVNPNTSTVILGASKPEQVLDNLKALDVIPKLTPEVLEKIEAILQTKPSPVVRVAAPPGLPRMCSSDADTFDTQPTYGRPPLDKYGRQ